jgi:hypothetical protein
MKMTSNPSTKILGAGHGIIDVHSHALLPLWLDAASQALNISRDKLQIAGTPVPDWSVDIHLAMMDAYGIAACVLSWPPATSFLKGNRLAIFPAR